MAGDNVDEEAIAEQTEYMGLDVDSMRKEEGNFIYSSPSGMYEVTANMNEDGSLVSSYEIAISLGEEYSVNGKANDMYYAEEIQSEIAACVYEGNS